MKGSGTKGLEESLSLKIQEATSKSVAITEKEEKKNNMSDKWYTPSWGTYIQKLTVIDFTG